MNNLLLDKRVAIVTNNVHCERHTAYYATVEKYFRTNGWKVCDDLNVDKIIICGCGFHDLMYEKFIKILEAAREVNFPEKNIIVMACLPKTQSEKLKEQFGGEIIGIHEEEILDRIIGAKVEFKDVKYVNVFNKYNLTPPEKIPVYYVKISEGCLRECTFCIINKAKGYINSRPVEDIIKEVKTGVEKGYDKIYLMGEDAFAYGIDSNKTIIELVHEIKNAVPLANLYFSYLHIRWLEKYSTEIKDLCKKGWINELHIGLQHVNEHILDRMGRPINFSKLYDTIQEIKFDNPKMHMVADIMVGFPGETIEIFNELTEFFKKDKCFNKVKHFGYSDVNGATSTGFSNKVEDGEIARRWNVLNEVLGARSYSDEIEEERYDDNTFRITRFKDFSFCVNTFDKDGMEVIKNNTKKEVITNISDINDSSFNF